MLRRHLLHTTKTCLAVVRKQRQVEPIVFKCYKSTQAGQETTTRPGVFSPFFSPSQEEEQEEIARRHYPRKTAYDTAKAKKPPTSTKMLVRDYIDDSLYNPNYGYFSKQAVIFSPETDFDFTNMRDHLEFMNVLGQMYKEIEDEADEVDAVARQVWHTPTELFKVWIARFKYSF
jgi:hypothetical protein